MREHLRRARVPVGPVAVLAALCLCAGAGVGHRLHAHHSLSGVYDSNDHASIEGVVVQFHFVNPHPYLTVRVTEAGGRTADWRLEMDNRFELEDIGMTSQTLRPGDRITARGSRGHNKANSLYVRRLERPADQFWYEQVGSTPRMRGRAGLRDRRSLPAVALAKAGGPAYTPS